MPVPGDPIRGWIIYFADGTSVTGRTFADWSAAAVPYQTVMSVAVYFQATYTRWIGAVLDTEDYRQLMVEADYYWMDNRTANPTFGSGKMADVPVGLPNGALKSVGVMTSSDFQTRYNTWLARNTNP